MDRRAFTAGGIAAAAGVIPALSKATMDWQPTRTLRIIVPAAPGSAPDIVARPLAEYLSTKLGQNVIVENRPGAGGIIGMEAVVRSQPDGYTWGLATQSQLIFNPYLFEKLPYELNSVQLALRFATVSMIVAVHPSLPIYSLKDLIRWTTREALPMQLGVPPMGTPPHVYALLLQSVTGIRIEAIPFKGSAEVMAAAISGEVKLIVEAVSVIAHQVQAGKLRALAVISSIREPLLSDIPTVSESLNVKLPSDTWIGLVAAKGTPMASVSLIHREIQNSHLSAGLKSIYDRLGWRPILKSSPEEFYETVREDSNTWGVLIRNAGLRIAK